jgi:uncharacterized protein (DUF433 family)
MENILTRITSDPAVCQGKPSIRHMRFTVVQLLELLASGMSFSDILNDYPYLEQADIEACLLYTSKIADTKNVIALSV